MVESNTLTSGPIAAKLIARLKRGMRRRGSPIEDIAGSASAAEELRSEFASQAEMSGMPRAFAAYLFPQMQVSMLAGELMGQKEMAELGKLVAKAEDDYMPDGPPMSPLTRSYFTCWSLFDACAGPARETFGTAILELCTEFEVDSGNVRLIRQMQESRMGLYIRRGRKAGLTLFEDVVTGEECQAVVASGDCGKKGELWYVRILPPPDPDDAEHVVFTTPYIVLHPGVDEWREYFRRAVPPEAPAGEYERHMKFGTTPRYWTEYVFEAYVNHRPEAVYLAGLPDVPESRPHSRISEDRGWRRPASAAAWRF